MKAKWMSAALAAAMEGMPDVVSIWGQPSFLGGESFFRCVYFIPNVIFVAVIACLWKFIYNPNLGLLNKILKAFGFQGNVNYLSAENAIWSVLVVLIWHGFGWGMLICYDVGVKNPSIVP